MIQPHRIATGAASWLAFRERPGPRHSGVVSVWSCRDEPEGDQRPGGVSGVVTVGGGDSCSGDFMVATARLRSMAMTCGPFPAWTWEWSSR